MGCSIALTKISIKILYVYNEYSAWPHYQIKNIKNLKPPNEKEDYIPYVRIFDAS